MNGETDLKKLLTGLKPVDDEIEYGFGILPPGKTTPAGITAFAIIQEREAATIIAPADQLATAGLEHTPGWSKITLTVHSSLSAVGLTAAVATILAEAGISANVVAAYHHDHVFVPLNRKNEAISLLSKLGQAG